MVLLISALTGTLNEELTNIAMLPEPLLIGRGGGDHLLIGEISFQIQDPRFPSEVDCSWLKSSIWSGKPGLEKWKLNNVKS